MCIVHQLLGWSSDGTELLFQREDLTDQGLCCPDHLYILRADGTETELNMDAMYMDGATIAPDGSRVVFAAGDYRGRPGLFVVDAEGGRPVRIAQEGEHRPSRPTGSRSRTSPPGRTGAHVWVANADGSDAHEILADEPALAEGFRPRVVSGGRPHRNGQLASRAMWRSTPSPPTARTSRK